LPVSAIEAKVEQAEQRQLLVVQRDAIGRLVQVKPSDRGFDFLSDLQGLFLPDD
jgi:oxygen-independent coproporphyrinogen-3 oxidase